MALFTTQNLKGGNVDVANIGNLPLGLQFGVGENTAFIQGQRQNILQGGIVKNLKLGERNLQVFNLQKQLKDIGFNINPTGTFDQSTAQALGQFQNQVFQPKAKENLGLRGDIFDFRFTGQELLRRAEKARQEKFNEIRHQGLQGGIFMGAGPQQRDFAPDIAGIQKTPDEVLRLRKSQTLSNFTTPKLREVTSQSPSQNPTATSFVTFPKGRTINQNIENTKLGLQTALIKKQRLFNLRQQFLKQLQGLLSI